jgi:hypothetical protein
MNDKENSNYEFNDGENSVISELAKAMKFVGTSSIVLGILTALGGLAQGDAEGVGSIIQGVLFVILGVMTQGASEFFMRVVNTKGDDISNLMAALTKLKEMYSLQRTILLIALVLIGLAVVLIFVGGARR